MKRIFTALSIAVGALPHDLPCITVAESASLAYAATYMTPEQAKREAFPAATSFTPIAHEAFEDRADCKAWKVFQGDAFLGYLVFDAVIGKHLYIDYVVGFNPSGQVVKINVLEYRENYGYEVAQQEWLAHFTGKNSDQIEFDESIPNISGATYSAKHITEGVHELAAIIQSLHI